MKTKDEVIEEFEKVFVNSPTGGVIPKHRDGGLNLRYELIAFISLAYDSGREYERGRCECHAVPSQVNRVCDDCFEKGFRGRPCPHAKVETPQPDDWERGFDEKFLVSVERFMTLPGRELKSFIRSLLQSERERVRGRVESEKIPLEFLSKEMKHFKEGYNKAIDDVLSILEEK